MEGKQQEGFDVNRVRNACNTPLCNREQNLVEKGNVKSLHSEPEAVVENRSSELEATVKSLHSNLEAIVKSPQVEIAAVEKDLHSQFEATVNISQSEPKTSVKTFCEAVFSRPKEIVKIGSKFLFGSGRYFDDLSSRKSGNLHQFESIKSPVPPELIKSPKSPVWTDANDENAQDGLSFRNLTIGQPEIKFDNEICDQLVTTPKEEAPIRDSDSSLKQFITIDDPKPSTSYDHRSDDSFEDECELLFKTLFPNDNFEKGHLQELYGNEFSLNDLQPDGSNSINNWLNEESSSNDSNENSKSLNTSEMVCKFSLKDSKLASDITTIPDKINFGKLDEMNPIKTLENYKLIEDARAGSSEGFDVEDAHPADNCFKDSYTNQNKNITNDFVLDGSKKIEKEIKFFSPYRKNVPVKGKFQSMETEISVPKDASLSLRCIYEPYIDIETMEEIEPNTEEPNRITDSSFEEDFSMENNDGSTSSSYKSCSLSDIIDNTFIESMKSTEEKLFITDFLKQDENNVYRTDVKQTIPLESVECLSTKEPTDNCEKTIILDILYQLVDSAVQTTPNSSENVAFENSIDGYKKSISINQNEKDIDNARELSSALAVNESQDTSIKIPILKTKKYTDEFEEIITSKGSKRRKLDSSSILEADRNANIYDVLTDLHKSNDNADHTNAICTPLLPSNVNNRDAPGITEIEHKIPNQVYKYSNEIDVVSSTTTSSFRQRSSTSTVPSVAISETCLRNTRNKSVIPEAEQTSTSLSNISSKLSCSNSLDTAITKCTSEERRRITRQAVRERDKLNKMSIATKTSTTTGHKSFTDDVHSENPSIQKYKLPKVSVLLQDVLSQKDSPTTKSVSALTIPRMTNVPEKSIQDKKFQQETSENATSTRRLRSSSDDILSIPSTSTARLPNGRKQKRKRNHQKMKTVGIFYRHTPSRSSPPVTRYQKRQRSETVGSVNVAYMTRSKMRKMMEETVMTTLMGDSQSQE